MDTSTRTPAPTTTAAQFVAELHANVEAWYAQENTPETYEAFSQRNGAIWRRIEAAGRAITDEVARLLREPGSVR